MKKVVFLLVLTLFGILFSQEAKNPFSISGNVYTGLRSDITKSSNTIYANENSNGTPIWANVRASYSFDDNAGAVLNFRVKGIDSVFATSSRFYLFLNRGYIWSKFAGGQVKIRTGYLWDSDFETSNNGWDTASNYEWVTEATFNPAKNLEIGATLPTPYDGKTSLEDSAKNTTYGVLYSPTNFRLSIMGEYGATESNRDVNFGVDFTGIKNTLFRIEGDLQQIGFSDLGYNQLFQETSYTFGSVTSDIQVTEYLYKNGDSNKFKIYPNILFVNNGVSYYTALNVTLIKGSSDIYKQIEVSAKKNINPKTSIKGGSYFTFDPSSDFMFSPYLEFIATF
jgi:hypothetical protein